MPAELLARRIMAIRRLGPLRLAGTALVLVLALLVARFGWQAPLLLAAERALYDIRVTSTATKINNDARIVQVVYTDDTLVATGQRSPLDRTTLARALASIDAMGAKAIAVDILIDQPQDDDPWLVETLRAMKTPTWLAYADEVANARAIQFNQRAFLDEFQRTIANPRIKPASIRLDQDSDGVYRAWPGKSGLSPPLLAVALSGKERWRDYHGAVRWRLPIEQEREVFDALPIELFAEPATSAAFAAQIHGRYVLIGGHILDEDLKETPLRTLTGEPIWGLELHAHLLAQILDNAAPPPLPGWALWLIALAMTAAGGMTSLIGGAQWKLAAVFGGQAALLGYTPIWLQENGVDTLGLPALGWGLGWLIALGAVSAAARAVGAGQRQFAQAALGRYLPRDIAEQIIADPDRLALSGEKRDIFCVVSDLEGFTELSQKVAPEQVASLLNRYLDTLSGVVLDHGGTLDKFVGDAVVAFWGAPIARPDDGERAARAAYAMWRAGEDFRATLAEEQPPIGRTRVGLHYGEAVVGNFGGEGRIQYTAVGDAMNTAARLEDANKQLGSNVVASRDAAERSNLDWWRPLGQITLRGRATPVEIFEAAPDMPGNLRVQVRALLDRIEAGDRDAVSDLTALARSRPADTALASLARRLAHSEAGGSIGPD